LAVGAPPDDYNQQGQGWSQPPWRPQALAEAGYVPYRDMLRAVLRHAGGIRVDHVLGLFRLWLVPDGATPDRGTYLRQDHEALVGILALEAARAGALVIGEDLGTVEPWVREFLHDRGIAGTSILWFERGWSGEPLPAEQWRSLCLASVTTHDLPPTAGYLRGDHVRIREQLGLLTRPAAEELAADTADRQRWLAHLRERGLLPPEPAAGRDQPVPEVVEALHRFLVGTPARLLGVSLPDAVGDLRAQNQPGTDDEYPNWRVPLTDADGHPVRLEELPASARLQSLVRVMSELDVRAEPSMSAASSSFGDAAR
jgi:4-alpha-glucanotransferase